MWICSEQISKKLNEENKLQISLKQLNKIATLKFVYILVKKVNMFDSIDLKRAFKVRSNSAMVFKLC